ncbi:MAG TPA: ABC transporter permease subunit, partial [Vicinamibacterales bacterium]|nr:ABC transporter permease subunit [Vicinamibacterales bacterium]
MTIDTSSLWPALEFALIGAAVSTAMGGALGCIAGTVEVPGRRWSVAMSVALLAAPPAFWWIGFTKLQIASGGFSGLLWGSVVAGVGLAPISLLLVLAATREIPANAYEAARLSLPLARRVWHVLLPMVIPALAAGFLLTAILLLGESEIPFLFGFRTSMTDVVTTFSQTFDATRTGPIVIPLVVAVLMLALTIVMPLFRVLLSTSGANRGVVRKRAHSVMSAVLMVLPVVVLSATGGYVLAATGGDTLIWHRVSGWPVVAPSIAESVLCSLSALCIGIVVAYPVRRSRAATGFAVVGLLLFCIPTAVTA